MRPLAAAFGAGLLLLGGGSRPHEARAAGPALPELRRTSTFVPAVLLGVLWCPPVGHAAGAAEREKETAVFVAVFRQQVQEHLDATERTRGTVVCLAIDPGGAPQSPGRELMARLAGETSVRRAAECEALPEGAVEATTRRPAILVTAGPIEWVAEDEAWVAVSYYRSASQSARRRYRVVREREGWVSLGPILLDGPA